MKIPYSRITIEFFLKCRFYRTVFSLHRCCEQANIPFIYFSLLGHHGKTTRTKKSQRIVSCSKKLQTGTILHQNLVVYRATSGFKSHTKVGTSQLDVVIMEGSEQCGIGQELSNYILLIASFPKNFLRYHDPGHTTDVPTS